VQSLKELLPPDNIKRIQAEPEFVDAESFCDYVKRFKTEATLIFASVSDTGCLVQAVMDYHTAKGPQWAEHRAKFYLQRTKEWIDWMATDKKEMSQSDFALFLENNEHVFEAPTGAELLELFTTLEGHSNARYQSGVKLKNRSVRLSYEEDVELRGSSGVSNGSLELPGLLVVKIAPFEHMEPVSISARLRYRLENRAVRFWYETVRAHQIVRDSVRASLASIETLTGIKALLGSITIE
jgi:uncharacterized protein YfdQ (DUF2303 family)